MPASAAVASRPCSALKLRQKDAASTSRVSAAKSPRKVAAAPRGAVQCKAGFFGSPENLIMMSSTGLMLVAGRFGLAPSSFRRSTADLKLNEEASDLLTGDPAGFTIADVLGCGAVGHVIGIGTVLGLQNIGAIQ